MVSAPEVSERPDRADSVSTARAVLTRLLVAVGVGIIVLIGWSASASADAAPAPGGLPTGPTSNVVDTTGSLVEPVTAVLPPAPPVTVPEVPQVVPTAPVVSDVIEQAPQPSVPTPGQVIPPIEVPHGGPAPALPVDPIPPVVDPNLPVDPSPVAPIPPVVDPIDGAVTPVEGIVRPVGEPAGREAHAVVGEAERGPGVAATPSLSSSPSGPSAQLVGALLAPFDDLIAASTSIAGAPGFVAPVSIGDGTSPGRPAPPPPLEARVSGCGSGSLTDRSPTGAPSAVTLAASDRAARAAARTAVFDGQARCSSIARARPEVAPD
ncbi:hypothetical protein ACE2AJ_17340 [Aquihabitans daechungensis]|uniref:hypothetical protein n=1 Tax=Aquihabitans daechungensis TaxID=1052257 RepID=UPI003B9F8AA0